MYLPGADGTSAGTDNVYLDFVSFEADGGDAPTGLFDLNLPSLADNAYYTGNTALGNDNAANWVRYDGFDLGATLLQAIQIPTKILVVCVLSLPLSQSPPQTHPPQSINQFLAHYD